MRLLLALLLLPCAALAQSLPFVPADPGPYSPQRYDEDWTRMRDPVNRTDWFDGLKAIRLGPETWLSLGGEIRQRVEANDAPRFGLAGVGHDDYLLSRYLLHADLHVGENVRAFVQLGLHTALDRHLAGATDTNGLDLQQAFLDLRAPGDGVTLTTRLGRQEIALGSQRFIDTREGLNVRRAFDGARLMFRAPSGAALDILAVRPVTDRLGAFDDTPSQRSLLAGAYASLPALPDRALAIDPYILLLQTRLLPAPVAKTTENRVTIGLRAAGRAAGFDYDIEAATQQGSRGPLRVDANGAALKAGYTAASWPLAPRFGLQADWFTGNNGPAGGTLHGFNPLFPRGGYFSEPGLSTFQNLVDIFPMVTLNPDPTLAIELGAQLAWRATTRDAVYIAPSIPLAGTAGNRGRRIGTLWTLQSGWTASRHVTVFASYVYGQAGPAITNAHGRDMQYLAVWTAFKF